MAGPGRLKVSKAEPWPNVPLARSRTRSPFVLHREEAVVCCRLRVCESHRNVVFPEIKLTDEVGAAEDHPRDAKTGLQVTQAHRRRARRPAGPGSEINKNRPRTGACGLGSSGLPGGEAAAPSLAKSLFPERTFVLAPRQVPPGQGRQPGSCNRTPGQPGFLVVWAWAVFLHHPICHSQSVVSSRAQPGSTTGSAGARLRYKYGFVRSIHSRYRIVTYSVLSSQPTFLFLRTPRDNPMFLSAFLSTPWSFRRVADSWSFLSCLARVARVRPDSVCGPQRSCPRRSRQGTSPMVPMAGFISRELRGAAWSTDRIRFDPASGTWSV